MKRGALIRKKKLNEQTGYSDKAGRQGGDVIYSRR